MLFSVSPWSGFLLLSRVWMLTPTHRNTRRVLHSQMAQHFLPTVCTVNYVKSEELLMSPDPDPLLLGGVGSGDETIYPDLSTCRRWSPCTMRVTTFTLVG